MYSTCVSSKLCEFIDDDDDGGGYVEDDYFEIRIASFLSSAGETGQGN